MLDLELFYIHPVILVVQKLSNLDTDLKPRARQNVVFEHGYLIGKLGRNKVCALVKEEVNFHQILVVSYTRK